ncbi:MAG: polysaccharide deacetylase family protein [Bacteroidetes bacterium]|nr:MAG: polysaccharide deacetylase family protein [Bacteroidota bacterium]
MLNYRNTNKAFIALIIILVIYQLYFGASFGIYAFAIIPYILVLVYGSCFIGSGFYLPVICDAKTEKKHIALSFDDGPDAEFTPAILDILKKNEVEAAFFLIGKRLEDHPSISQLIDAQGHIIGNHSYSHDAWFDLYSSKKMKEDLKRVNDLVKQLTGKYPQLFRPPYGVTNPNLAKAVKDGEYISIGWNIRSFDTVIHNKEKLLRRILNDLKPGAIILLHDTSPTMVSILPDLINQIKSHGFELIRLDKMLNLQAYA